MCATHGVTYPSVCRLLQDTGNEAVAYAGECNREECQGGSVSTCVYKRMYEEAYSNLQLYMYMLQNMLLYIYVLEARGGESDRRSCNSSVSENSRSQN